MQVERRQVYLRTLCLSVGAIFKKIQRKPVFKVHLRRSFEEETHDSLQNMTSS